jgi:hypothetical protein
MLDIISTTSLGAWRTCLGCTPWPLELGGRGVIRSNQQQSDESLTVIGAGGRIEIKERVHGLHLPRVSVHPTGRLTGLDVAPDHGGHVTFVIHETGVEVRRGVWIGRLDVSEPTGERVLQEVEHGEEVPRRPIIIPLVKASEGWCQVVRQGHTSTYDRQTNRQ